MGVKGIPHDSPLSDGHTSDRAEGALNLEELFSICTNLSNRVLALETVDAQAVEIIALKDRIKKLEKKRKPGSTKELVSTARPEDSTIRPNVGTTDPIAPPSTIISIFDDEDITMAQTLNKMKEEKAKEKRVSIKDIKDSSRPARSILTLKPLPTIDPKDKGKGVLEEPNPAKKMTKSDLDAAQIAKDAEVERLVYEEELAELEREKEKRQREEEASKAAIAEMYDEVPAGIEADALFTAKLQQEEREEYVIEERAKFLAETIAAQKRLRAVQRSAEIRSRPPTKSQLRNLMMTYMKNMVLRLKLSKKEIKRVSGKDQEMKAKKKSKRKKTDFDLKEEEHLKTFLHIVSDEEGEVDYEVLDKRFPIINWESKFYHLDRHRAECIYYRIFRSDRSSRWIKTFSEMVTRFDMMDLEELYNLVMQRFETISPKGVDLVLWSDLRTMFEETADDDLWKNQEEWILKKRRYPLTKETLERMLALRLIDESESETIFDLLRFIQNQIDESGSNDVIHRFWFVQEIVEEEGLLKFLRDRCDYLRRKSARRHVLIFEMEALGERRVAVDSLECLKQTHAREIAKLAA
nr:hypothetical protein [Tanacetum cinerariifolium]